MALVFFMAGLPRVFSQCNDGTDYIIQQGDTIRTVSVRISAVDTCFYLQWLDREGEFQKIECPANQKVKGFGINGRDYILYRLHHNPVYLWRKVSGPVSLLVNDFTTTSYYDQNMPEAEARQWIDDGTGRLIKLRTKKDIRRHLLETLTSCKGFRDSYYGRFNPEYLELMLTVYKNKCVAEPRAGSNWISFTSGDSLKVTSIEFARSGTELSRVRYVTGEGRLREISGLSECQKITGWSLNGQVYRRVPLLMPGESSGQTGMTLVAWEKIRGVVSEYIYQRTTHGIERDVRVRMDQAPDIEYRLILLDDLWVRVDEDSISSVIAPFLLRCQQVNTIFNTESLSEPDNLETAIKIYNSCCEELVR
ncbi:MAG: hypothetical protein Kow00127_13260 [Bacteroidales bacterium]